VGGVVTGGGVGVEPPPGAAPEGEPDEGGGVPPLAPDESEGAAVDEFPADGVVLDELLDP
jgi:hypothetical protein